MSNPLFKLEGSFVKLVFRDGDTVVAKRGDLTEVGEQFVELQTRETELVINITDIVKIQKRGGPK